MDVRPSDQIRVLGESDEHELCIITLEKEDLAGGIDVAQLKALICTHPAVEALFGHLSAATIKLRAHVPASEGAFLRNNARGRKLLFDGPTRRSPFDLDLQSAGIGLQSTFNQHERRT
jgi:hypothetical protein